MKIDLNSRPTLIRFHGSFFSNYFLHWIERVCWVLGGSALGWCFLFYVDMALLQASQARQFEELRRTVAAVPETPTGGPIAKIRIPRISLSAVVVNGDDERILSRAVGHIRGTASPGGIGTVGLAGHRDTFFRGLGRVHKNDEIFIETPSATYRYRVANMAIVEPGNVGVLRPLNYPALVLVTCYPFSFVGRAPQRYVVTALRAPTEELADPVAH